MKFSTLSPCKLNLFLYITNKRADGYHDLQTLFVILDKGDMMHFETCDDDKVHLLTDFGFEVEKNLIYKAAMLLKEHCHYTKGIKISIDKVLPQGGGLGGGSANAATTLLVLNKLWDLNLDEDTLVAHFNTRKNEYLEYLTTGDRTLVVTKNAKTYTFATDALYDEVAQIEFEGKTHRKDLCAVLI